MKHPAQPQLQPNKPQTTNQTQNTTQKTSTSEFGAHKTATITKKKNHTISPKSTSLISSGKNYS
jgi:hypothetical protein